MVLAKPTLALPIAAMTLVVVASNILVQFPINDWLTWGAFTYPFSFLVTDLTNRRMGPAAARRAVYVGFAIAVVLSIALATPRIALASGMAFLVAQLLDITVFNRMRLMNWWKAPLASGGLAAVCDTTAFFGIAFAFTGLPWMSWAAGDLMVKGTMILLLLAPYRALMSRRDIAAAAA
ncbi:VUT family protein [Marinivivus vitaminiproducens]|uniref:VUT family protein n=1 Tax=Marinivivus vitaminiproducens TaxID=3035935 RepID=UPI0027A9ABCA|nr:VUT family protein [Geminicoccaceae bacterium SCSIO 64248]